MSKSSKVASVIDEVIAEAQLARSRSVAEAGAVKTASALPTNGIARDLKNLSQELRGYADALTYEDLQ